MIRTLAPLILIGSATMASAGVIGGFDASRGGGNSIDNALAFQANVESEFPGTTFASAPVLNDAFLGTVDVLVIGVAFADQTAITPLSADEQDSLLRFVENGGSAILLTDNDIQFEAASDSLVAKFGMDTTGVLTGAQTASTTDPTHPIMSGPFGTISSLDLWWPGTLSSLGPNGQELARLDQNSAVAAGVIDRNALGQGSGVVVVLSDSRLADSSYDGTTVVFMNNSLAHAELGTTPLCPAQIAVFSRQLPYPLNGLLTLNGRQATLEMARAFRDRVLATNPAGRRITASYYRHSDEIKRLMASNPRLMTETVHELIRSLSTIRSAVANPLEFNLSRKQYVRASSLLERYMAVASPELKSALHDVRDYMHGRVRKEPEGIERPANRVTYRYGVEPVVRQRFDERCAEVAEVGRDGGTHKRKATLRR